MVHLLKVHQTRIQSTRDLNYKLSFSRNTPCMWKNVLSSMKLNDKSWKIISNDAIQMKACVLISLSDFCFLSCSRIFHSYWEVTIAGEGLQNTGLCLLLLALKQTWTLSLHTLTQRTKPFIYSSYDKPGVLRTQSIQDP